MDRSIDRWRDARPKPERPSWFVSRITQPCVQLPCLEIEIEIEIDRHLAEKTREREQLGCCPLGGCLPPLPTGLSGSQGRSRSVAKRGVGGGNHGSS
jgi:hypothetical protein